MAQKTKLNEQLASKVYQEAVKRFVTADPATRNRTQQQLANSGRNLMQQAAARQGKDADSIISGAINNLRTGGQVYERPSFDKTYAEAVKRLVLTNPDQTKTLSEGAEVPNALKNLQKATNLYTVQGGAEVDPTYQQLLNRYFDATPTTETQKKIQKLGGYGALTQQTLDAMSSKENYRPEDDLWGLLFNPKVKQAAREAYINQETDEQAAAQAYGAYDTPQYLLTDISLVSDDYLAYMQSQLPGMWEDEQLRYEQENAAYPQRMATWNTDINNFINQERGNLEVRDRLYSIYHAEDQNARAEALKKLAAEDIESLVALDNLIKGETKTTSYLNTYKSEEKRAAELERLVNQYGKVALDAQPDEYAPQHPTQYPYDKLLEYVNNEVEGRAVMNSYLSVVAEDPEFIEKSAFVLKYPQGQGKGQYDEEDLDIDVALGLYKDDGTGVLTTNQSLTSLGDVDRDMLEYLIINGEAPVDGSKAYAHPVVINEYYDKGYDMMTDVERSVYNYYYNTGDKAKAKEYLKVMEPILQSRWKDIRAMTWEELATDNVFTGTLAFVLKGVGGTAAALSYPLELGMTALGVENVDNPFTSYRNVVSQEQLAALEDADWLGVEIAGQNIPQILYNVGSSMQDMYSARGMANVLGAPNAALGLMGAAAGAHDLTETAGSDMSNSERALHSIGVAGLEGLTEKLPFEAANATPGSLGYLAGTFASEFGEEAFNQGAGYALDDLTALAFGRETSTEEALTQMRLLGVENPGLELFRQRGAETLGAGVAGGLAGFGMGTTQTVTNAAQTVPTGRKVDKAGNASQLVELGTKMKEGTESRKLAEKLIERQNNGKKLSSMQLGQLYRAMIADTHSDYQGVVRELTKEAVTEAIAQKYHDLGLEPETTYTTEELAEGIIALSDGEKLSGRLQRYIETHRATMEIAREFRAEENQMGWVQQLNTQKLSEKMRHLSDIVQIDETTQKKPPIMPQKEQTGEIQQQTEQETRRLVGDSTAEAGSREIAFSDGSDNERTAELLRVERTNGALQIVVNDGGTEKTVSYDDLVHVNGSGVARILAYAQQHIETEAPEINLMLEQYKTNGGEAVEIISAVEEGVAAGYFGAAAPAAVQQAAEGQPDIAAAARQQLVQTGYNLGQQMARGAEAKRLQNVGRGVAGKGAVSYMGMVANSESIADTGKRQALKGIRSRMTGQQDAAIRVIEQIATVTGINFVFYESTAAQGEKIVVPNGFFDAATNEIFLDLNSGRNVGGEALAETAVIKTAAHELTHFIERNSGEEYAAFRQAARAELAARGQDYAQLVMDKARERSLTRAQAEAEVLADAAEMMLKDSDAVQRLAKQKPGLAGTIKKFLSDFTRRLRRAFEGLTGTSAEAKALTQVVSGVERYVGNLQQLWDDALVKAAGNAAGAATEAVSVKVGERVNSFAGRSAKSMNKTLLQQAIDMTEAGEKDVEIRKKTGWFRGMDGQWRFEIDDKAASVIAKHVRDEGIELQEVLEHESLYKAYPFLRAMKVYLSDLGEGTRGRFNGSGIVLNSREFSDEQRTLQNGEGLKYTLLHEIQHAIQDYEGFAGGASPRTWANIGIEIASHAPIIRKTQQEMHNLLDSSPAGLAQLMVDGVKLAEEQQRTINEWMDAEDDTDFARLRDKVAEIEERILANEEAAGAFEDGVNKLHQYTMLEGALKKAIEKNHIMTAEEKYRMTAGEIEARDVQKRMSYTEEQRKTFAPENDVNAVFAENPFSRQYSARRSIDGMTAQKYNRYGWAVLSEAVTDTEMARFMERIGALKSGDQYPRTSNGMYIICVGNEESEVRNTLIVTDGDFNSPSIERVYRVQVRNETKLDYYRRLILNAERESHEKAVRTVLESDQQELVIVYGREDSPSYSDAVQRYRSLGGTRRNGGEAYADDRGGRVGRGNALDDGQGGSVRYSTRRRAAPSIRQALNAMAITPDMTETEKTLLKIYQKYATELTSLQEQMTEQEAIMQGDTATADEKRQAENRLNILRNQARRAEAKLRQAERSDGFATLMSTSRGMVKRFMAAEGFETTAAAVEDQLTEVEKELQRVRNDLSGMSDEQQAKMVRELFDVAVLNRAAKNLKASYQSRISQKEISNRLAVMYANLYSTDTDAAVRFHDQLQELASDLLNSARNGSTETLELLKESISSIRLTEAQVQELKHRGISMTTFKRTVNPVVRISEGKDADTLLSYITESDEGTPNPVAALFAGFTSEGDAIVRLYELIASENENRSTIPEADKDAIIGTMVDITEQANLPAPEGVKASDIILGAMLKTAEVNDAMQKRLRELDAKMVAARKGVNTMKVKAAQQAGVPQQIARYYSKLEEQRRLMELQEETERIKEQLKTYNRGKMQEFFTTRELMEKNATQKRQIKRTVTMLDRRIRKETDSKRIPEGFKPVVEEMMRLFIEANDVLHIFAGNEVGYVKQVYTKLAALDGTDRHQLDSMYKENVDDILDGLRTAISHFSAEMPNMSQAEKLAATNQCLEDINDLVQTVRRITIDIDTTIIDGQRVSLEQTAGQMATELDAKEDYSIWEGKPGEITEKLKDAARNGNLTPTYFFRLVKNETLSRLNRDIEAAEARYGLMRREAQDRMRSIQDKHNYYAWKDDEALTFTTTQGQGTTAAKHTVTLTKDEAMAIWATWKREHDPSGLFVSSHLENGGFTLREGKRTEDKRVKQDTLGHKLSANDMQVIDNYLTAEQKAYADEIVAYLSTDMAELGNETSMELFGIRKFKEGYYFPMSVNRGQLAQKSSAGTSFTDTNRIAHTSMTKRRVDQANKTLVIGSLTDVAADHINQMLLYNTFAIPIENLNRVLNQITDDETGSTQSLRQLFEQKYGEDLLNYLTRYIADLNGGPQRDSVEKGLDKLVSLYKKGAVVGSLSVAVQQPMSMFRAMLEVNPKYFVPVLNHADSINWRREHEQLMQYSGVAVLKDVGGFDMTNKGGANSAIAGHIEDTYNVWKRWRLRLGIGDAKGAERWKAAGRTWNDLFGFFASKADEMTWSYMWRAIKAETADRNPGMDTSSEAFLQMAAHRFNEVMRLTQVYDSTLVKSQNMRRKTAHMKAFTAFMAEPTLTANILMDAAASKDLKRIGRAVANTLVSTVLTAAASAVIKAGRDDDKDKTWEEKWLYSMGSNLGGWSSALNPLTLLPGFRDLMSLLDGYDIERSDMSVITDLVDAYEKLANGKYDNPWQAVENVGGAAANLLGIPLKNIMRDLRTMYNTVFSNAQRPSSTLVMENDALYNYRLNHIWEPETGFETYYGRLLEAYRKGDTKEQALLKEYLTINGKDDATISSGVKAATKKAILSGDLSEDEALKLLKVAEIGGTDNDRYWVVQEWLHQRDGEAGDYHKYDAFFEAVETGKDLKQTIKVYTDHGVKASTLHDQLRKNYRDEFVSLSKTNRTAAANLQARLLNAYVALGYDREKKLKDIQAWLKEN